MLILFLQVQGSKFVATQLTTDYKGSSYTASLTLGNPDFINGSGNLPLSHYNSSCVYLYMHF